MNRKIKSIFSGIAALVFSAVLFSACSNGTDTSTPDVPSLNAEDQIDLSSSDVTAASIVNAMKFGWNLGNTLDANDNGENWSKQSSGNEIDWGLKGTATDALFQKLYDSGIRTVRLPVSWHNHVDSDLDINSAWMNHVLEIANMAYKRKMFVIINIHHDTYSGTSLGSNAGYTLNDCDKAASENYVSKIWTQIANAFKDYDGHIVFETLNEPRIIGTTHEWNCTSNSWTCSECQKYFAILNSLNQKAVDAIRATGGNNSGRVIMFPAYVAAPYAAINAKRTGLFKVPSDTAAKRLALSVHMYTPYNFAMNTGNGAVSEFSASLKTELKNHFTDLNSAFIQNDIPVVIGEMGATNKNNFSERKSWFTYYLGLCKDYNMAAVLWDNGQETNENPSEAFGYMNRSVPDWFTDSKAAELIAAAVNAR